MSHTFEENLARHRRLAILKLLAGSDDQGGTGTANESLLLDCIESLGLDQGVTRQNIRDDLKWLAERDLVRNTMVSGTLMVAHVTERGVDCARGRVVVDGVKKPSVGAI